MGRLFIGEREVKLAADLTRELMEDVCGEEIILYPISEARSDVHPVYDESIDKVSEHPIRVNAFVDWGTQDVRTGKLATETVRQVEVYLFKRDLTGRNIDVFEGDFFSYGSHFFEIVSLTNPDLGFGQIEAQVTTKLVGREAREGQFRAKLNGRRLQHEFDVPRLPFAQQRGFEKNVEGDTGSKRELREDGVLEEPLTGPKEVSERGGSSSGDPRHSFYDE